MPTVDQYRIKLQRATEAGDDAAVKYFQSQIDKGVAAEAQASKGTILSPLAQGATFGFSDELAGTGAGLYNMYQGGDFSSAYDETAKDFRESADAYRERNPITSTVAEIAGGLAMPIGVLGAGRSALTAGKGLRTALASGALYGAGTADGDLADRATGAGVGAAAGGLGYGALKGASALTRNLFGKGTLQSRQPGFKKQVKTLKDTGIPLTSGEELANKNLRQSQESLARVFRNEDVRPQTLFSKLMKMSSGKNYGFTPQDVKIGELSSEAVERATQRYSKAYDEVLDNVTVEADDWWRSFAPVEQKFDDLLPHERGLARAVVDDFRNVMDTKRALTGREYKRLRSRLSNQANAARTSPTNQGLYPILKGLKDSLDDGFRNAAPAKVSKRLKDLDRNYGAFKELSKASANPEALGTFANAVRRNRHRLPKDYVELVEAYQDVILRGYPRSSMTAEGMTFGDLPRTIAHGVRAATGPASKSYEKLRSKVIPAPGQRAPKQRARNAAVQKSMDPILRALQGGIPFSVGQQAQNTPLSAIPDALAGR